MIYITTGREPSVTSRRLCKSLAGVLPHAVCENRGKRGFDELIGRARSFGAHRLMLIYEKDGNPARLAFAKIGARSWEWLGELRVTVAGIGQASKLPKEIRVLGENAETTRHLLGVGEPETGDAVVLEAGKDALRFTYRGVEVGPVLKVKFLESAPGS